MTNAKVIRIIIGIIGNLLSSSISLSQMPKFIQVIKKKSVDGVDPVLHLAMVMKCSLWILYGLPVVHKDSILVTTNNGVGFIIEAICLGVFWIYCADEPRKTNIYVCIAVELSFLIAFYPIIIITGMPAKRTIVGVVCNVVNIYLYVSLAMETLMVETKSFKHIPCCSGVGTLLYAFELVIHAYLFVHSTPTLNGVVV